VQIQNGRQRDRAVSRFVLSSCFEFVSDFGFRA
jgi:hypothetical protein